MLVQLQASSTATYVQPGGKKERAMWLCSSIDYIQLSTRSIIVVISYKYICMYVFLCSLSSWLISEIRAGIASQEVGGARGQARAGQGGERARRYRLGYSKLHI